MAPRGLSLEEKRVKLLEIFHETKDFYQLRELEKLGPKMKGIVSQSVKEVLQSLVNDGLVQSDKIGSSNFFWSFPSQRGSLVQYKLTEMRDTQRGLELQLQELNEMTSSERVARPESDKRSLSLAELSDLRKKLSNLQEELDEYSDSDPEKVKEIQRAVFLAKEAAIRWTGEYNYSLLLTYFSRQTGTEQAEIRKYLGVEDDYEDID
ncbi:meiotic nuclear division protein 1 [Cyathus striatus]|nr:meiotic nuclear division protein 1 [Cyathus striatus]